MRQKCSKLQDCVYLQALSKTLIYSPSCVTMINIIYNYMCHQNNHKFCQQLVLKTEKYAGQYVTCSKHCCPLSVIICAIFEVYKFEIIVQDI